MGPVAGKILPHYPAMLAFAFEHRYVTADQLRRRFPDHIKSHTTAKYQARRLVEAGYLATATRGAPLNFPYVYLTTPKGIRLLAEAYTTATGRLWAPVAGEQNRPARGYGLLHLQHEIDITEIDLAIDRIAAGRDDLALANTDRRGRLPFVYHGLTQTVIPDAAYHLVHNRRCRCYLDLCFLELDRGNTPAPSRIRRKFARYDHWAASGEGRRCLGQLHRRHGDQHTAQPNFRLLVIARRRPSEGQDFDRLANLYTQALSTSRPMRQRTWLATFEDVMAHRDSLADPIWLRVRDATPWLDDFRRLAQGLTGDKFANYKLRLFVSRRLAEQARYTLFPPPSAAV